MKLILNKAKTKISKLKFITGFTLIELLVTITIFTILTGVVLFSQQKFNSTILLTNLAYDTALTIRQAQTYGINVKEFYTTGTSRFLPYGVHFNLTSPKSFILFADHTYTSRDYPGFGLYSSDLNSCKADQGCVYRYNITRGNSIKTICSEAVIVGTNVCSNNNNTLNDLSISFKRPNPNAIIRSTTKPNVDMSVATIILAGADGESFRKVRVWESGLIEIVN